MYKIKRQITSLLLLASIVVLPMLAMSQASAAVPAPSQDQTLIARGERGGGGSGGMGRSSSRGGDFRGSSRSWSGRGDYNRGYSGYNRGGGDWNRGVGYRGYNNYYYQNDYGVPLFYYGSPGYNTYQDSSYPSYYYNYGY